MLAKLPRHCPNVVVGAKSPYPTVVVVVKTHLQTLWPLKPSAERPKSRWDRIER